MEKLTTARRLWGETGARFVIKVDGGIKPLTAAAAAAGADVLVGGSAIFESSPDYGATIRALRRLRRPGGTGRPPSCSDRQ